MAELKETRELVRELERQRWRVEQTGRGHYKARPPDGRPMVTFGSASGDPRAMKNTLAQLRRSGFEWPPANGFRVPQVGRLEDGTEVREGDVLMGDGTVLRKEDTITVRAMRGGGVSAEAVHKSLLQQVITEGVIESAPSVDELFAALKAARADKELHAELLSEAEKHWIEAERELAEARAALIAAQKKLTETKAAFDAAFAVEET